MQRDRLRVAQTWLQQAQEDCTIARLLLSDHPARAAFHAQQAAEMALKGAVIAHSDDHPLTHAAGALVHRLREDGIDVPADVASDATALDLYYLGSRYPDAVGDADPTEIVPQEDAERAVARAERVIAFCLSFVKDAGKDAPLQTDASRNDLE